MYLLMQEYYHISVSKSIGALGKIPLISEQFEQKSSGIAKAPRQFGGGPVSFVVVRELRTPTTAGNELKLFLVTFSLEKK